MTILNSKNTFEDYLTQINKEKQKYDDFDYEISSKEISMIFDTIRLGLDDIIRHLDEQDRIIERIKNKYVKDFTKILENPLFKQYTLKGSSQYNDLNKLIEAIKSIPICPTTSAKRAELGMYYHSDKQRRAYIIGEELDESEGTIENNENGINVQIYNNKVEMKKLLESCGFVVEYVNTLIKLVNSIPVCDNSMDILIYYTDFSNIKDNEISIKFGNKSHNLNEVVKLLSNKEDDMLLTCSKKLKQQYREEQNLGPIKEEDLNTVFPNLFDTLSIKKIFIFDFIDNNDNSVSSLFNLKKPNFPISNNNIYLYSNISKSISNLFKNEKTTFLTSALINCIEVDKENNKGRNVSSISKVIQYDIINKLNLIKPEYTFEINFETKFKEIKNNKEFQVDKEKLLEIRNETSKLFGSKITEFEFGKLLLNNLPIIYGDASNCDFLILDK